MTEEERKIVAGLLALYERNVCTHEDTHRGGFLWTICDSCGAKWADDEGGFKPYVDPPEVVRARELLSVPAPEPPRSGMTKTERDALLWLLEEQEWDCMVANGLAIAIRKENGT